MQSDAKTDNRACLSWFLAFMAYGVKSFLHLSDKVGQRISSWQLPGWKGEEDYSFCDPLEKLQFLWPVLGRMLGARSCGQKPRYTSIYCSTSLNWQAYWGEGTFFSVFNFLFEIVIFTEVVNIVGVQRGPCNTLHLASPDGRVASYMKAILGQYWTLTWHSTVSYAADLIWISLAFTRTHVSLWCVSMYNSVRVYHLYSVV